jgi:hypothetical protein
MKVLVRLDIVVAGAKNAAGEARPSTLIVAAGRSSRKC